MSARALYGLPERSGRMTKRADGGAFGIFGQIGDLAYAQLLAAALLTGGGVGYAAAKLSAKGDADIATARKSYQNERARADIGNLSTKLKDEYEAGKAGKEVKPMRLV